MFICLSFHYLFNFAVFLNVNLLKRSLGAQSSSIPASLSIKNRSTASISTQQRGRVDPEVDIVEEDEEKVGSTRPGYHSQDSFGDCHNNKYGNVNETPRERQLKAAGFSDTSLTVDSIIYQMAIIHLAIMYLIL